MSVLQIKKAVKHYGNHIALKELVLDIRQNEFFGLIGLNGAGKTSLIKCILDLHLLNEGEITIFHWRHSDKRARSELAYLPEKFSPPTYMTGEEYLRFSLNASSCSFSAEAAMLLFDKLDLNKTALRQSIKSYSKGMLQKLGIAACLLSNKPLLVLDEPMSGLDPKARLLFRQILSDAKAEGKTILISTHILSDIEHLCDRIGLLHKGELRFAGTVENCCMQYKGKNLEQAFLNGIAD